MRQLFLEYYKPKDQDIRDMWQNGIFAFDANILLNFYRYSSETQERLFEVLRGLNAQIWLPHQAALEFHQNRLEVINDQFAVYDSVEKSLEKLRKDVSTTLPRRHLFIDPNEIVEIFDQAIEKVRSILQGAKAKHPDYIASDDVLD